MYLSKNLEARLPNALHYSPHAFGGNMKIIKIDFLFGSINFMHFGTPVTDGPQPKNHSFTIFQPANS